MMKIKLFFILFISPFLIFAQQEQKSQNPNVELPDFVITGKDVVSVQKSNKIAPDFVSTVSEEFLKPVFSPEQLEVKDISSPVKKDLNIMDTARIVNGSVYGGVGNVVLPEAGMKYSSTFKNGMFDVNIDGKNTRDFVPYSKFYSLNGGGNLYYFLNSDNSVLNGTKFKLHGNYGISSYHFYAAPDPTEKRVLNRGSFGFSFNNILHRIFILGADFSDDIYDIKDETFSENLFKINAFTKLKLSSFNLRLDLKYTRQTISNMFIGDGTGDFLTFRPAIGLDISDDMQAVFGFNIAKSGAEDYFTPYASIGLKIDKDLTFFGEYKPGADLLTAGRFLDQNKYMNMDSFGALFFKKGTDLNLTLKYEYSKYFEIDGGFRYLSSTNFPYFKDAVQLGRFDVVTTNARKFNGFLNLLFHAGPYGIFYGTAEFDDTRDTTDNFIPYSPRASASLTYGYNFKMGLSTEARLFYHANSFANIENTEIVDSFVDLGLKFAYPIMPKFNVTLELSNLLGHQNYNWKGYKETPFELTAGFNYRW